MIAELDEKLAEAEKELSEGSDASTNLHHMNTDKET